MALEGPSAPTGNTAELYKLAKDLSQDGSLDAVDQAAILDKVAADGKATPEEREAAAKLLANPEETVNVLQHHDLAFAATGLKFNADQLAASNAKIDASLGGPKGLKDVGG